MKRFQAVITWSPGHAQFMKSGGMTLTGDEMEVQFAEHFVCLTITDTNNAVKRVTRQVMNSVTVANLLVIEEEKELIHVQ